MVSYKGNFFVRKRTQKDIWQNLHEFILMENSVATSPEELMESAEFKQLAGKKYKLLDISKNYKQQLTHQTIYGCFIHIDVNKKILREEYLHIGKSEMKQLAFPKLISAWFADKRYL